MVNLKFSFFTILLLKVTSLLSPTLPFSFNFFSMSSVHLFCHRTFTSWFSPAFSHGLLCTVLFIPCAKYFSAFPHIPFSSLVIIPHCELFYAITFPIRETNLNFHLLFPVEFLSRGVCKNYSGWFIKPNS